jgi:hypothetical protein
VGEIPIDLAPWGDQGSINETLAGYSATRSVLLRLLRKSQGFRSQRLGKKFFQRSRQYREYCPKSVWATSFPAIKANGGDVLLNDDF